MKWRNPCDTRRKQVTRWAILASGLILFCLAILLNYDLTSQPLQYTTGIVPGIIISIAVIMMLENRWPDPDNFRFKRYVQLMKQDSSRHVIARQTKHTYVFHVDGDPDQTIRMERYGKFVSGNEQTHHLDEGITAQIKTELAQSRRKRKQPVDTS
jgi:hypothetical protein